MARTKRFPIWVSGALVLAVLSTACGGGGGDNWTAGHRQEVVDQLLAESNPSLNEQQATCVMEAMAATWTYQQLRALDDDDVVSGSKKLDMWTQCVKKFPRSTGEYTASGAMLVAPQPSTTTSTTAPTPTMLGKALYPNYFGPTELFSFPVPSGVGQISAFPEGGGDTFPADGSGFILLSAPGTVESTIAFYKGEFDDPRIKVISAGDGVPGPYGDHYVFVLDYGQSRIEVWIGRFKNFAGEFSVDVNIRSKTLSRLSKDPTPSHCCVRGYPLVGGQ